MPQLEHLHDAETVTADMRTALDIVAELEPPDELVVPVFQFVALLVTQRLIHPGAIHVPSGPQH